MISGHTCATPEEQALGQGRHNGSMPPATQQAQAHKTGTCRSKTRARHLMLGRVGKQSTRPSGDVPEGLYKPGEYREGWWVPCSPIALFIGFLLTSVQRLHFTSFTRMTSKHKRIADVPLWREAHPAEKRHLYVFALKPNPNAFKSTVSISNARFDIRGLTRSLHPLQYLHDDTTDKLYQ